jgi:glyoxylase-like metal-dependent hydrolase (beta-lactamase superfamily II)
LNKNRVLLALVWVLCIGIAPSTRHVYGSEYFEVQRITDDVFALVGSLGDRSPENLGTNATYGVVVTAEGVVLVDSGGTFNGAQRIHEAIKGLTDKPVDLVINTNGQDHRWLGNDYFRQQGAKIIAHRETVEDQRARLDDQLRRLSNTVGDNGISGTKPAYADEVFSDRLDLVLGGKPLQLHPVGQAHTPSDVLVWLPEEKVMFTGDVVYTERMLSVRPYSHSGSWLRAFEAMAAFEPEHLVPGHGRVTTLDRAYTDTHSYLRFLRDTVTEFLNDGSDLADIGTLDQSRFSYLKNYESLKGRNAQQVYQELEWEQ